MTTKLCPLLFLLASATSLAVALQVPVTVYFESLCSDSQKFFKEQFAPAYNSSLQSQIKPEFVPWGHANDTGNDTFSCQHKSVECDGNRLLACALEFLPNDTAKVSYVSCIMSLNITPAVTAFPTDQCQENAGDHYKNIIDCYGNLPTSAQYLRKYKMETDNFFGNQSFSVPYIAFNKTKDDQLSAGATKNFVSTLCNAYKDQKLEGCPNNSASTFAATLVPAVILLILGRL